MKKWDLMRIDKKVGIEILDFDSELFGFKVGKLIDNNLSPEKVEKVIQKCKYENIRCLYANLDINDFNTLATASKYNFIISDIRVNFEKNLTTFKYSINQKFKNYEIDDKIKNVDIPYLLALSKQLSQGSRFAFDKNFPKGSAEKLYQLWMLNSINKKVVDKVFVARQMKSKIPVGFVTCKKNINYGEIVFVAVDKKYRGKGVGSFIVDYALSYFKKMGIEIVQVVTHGKNISAQRLYQKNGFFVWSTSISFHLWLS